MFRDDTDKSWDNYGKTEPYYGVVHFERYRLENMDEQTRKEFFQTGRVYFQNLQELINKHMGGFSNRKSALDFGCGVGRILIPMAEEFESVTGIDVSEAMITEAKNNCNIYDIHNASFKKTIEAIPVGKAGFDFIHSFIVLQHIPTKRGMKYIERLVDLMNPEGIGVLHIMFESNKEKIRLFKGFISKYFIFVHYLMNLYRRKKWNESLMQSNFYHLNRVFKLLCNKGVQQIFLEFTDHGRYLGVIMLFKKEKDFEKKRNRWLHQT